MNNSQISKRYARALFELANETNLLPVTEENMHTVKIICEQVPEFRQVLKSPIIKPILKKKIISALFENSFNDLSIKFLKLVIKQGREAYLHEITNEFIYICTEHKGIIEVELTSATELNQNIVKQIETKIASLTGLKPNTSQKTNPNLLGGFTVRFGDNMYDASIKNKISKIFKDFQTNIYEKGF